MLYVLLAHAVIIKLIVRRESRDGEFGERGIKGGGTREGKIGKGGCKGIKPNLRNILIHSATFK
jgi:hypothetical protein